MPDQSRTTTPLALQRCRDCDAPEGSFHDLFCTQEVCPFCFTQLATCECIKSVLSLTPEECILVDEYLDDSIEPLKSLMSRWRSTLREKGRLRFVYAPVLCRRCGSRSPRLFKVADTDWLRVIPAHFATDVFCIDCYAFLSDQVSASQQREPR